MKIYTKTGDDGETSLYGGRRVLKSDARIEAVGSVDELNSVLGMVVAKLESGLDIATKIERVQTELFELGADLASPPETDEDKKLKHVRISESEVKQLESEIDAMQEKLPELKNFIMPGGTEAGAILHHARAACRSAERRIIEAASKTQISEFALQYINRLSDWLFVAARTLNSQAGVEETIWDSAK